jgi:mercuric transport protein
MRIAALLAAVSASASVAAAPQVITLSVPRMDCVECLLHVKHSLLAVDGVVQVEPDLSRRQATVTVDDDDASPPELVEALREEGYESTVVHTYAPRPRID